MMLVSCLDSVTAYIAFPLTLTLQSIYKIQICVSEKLQKINWGVGGSIAKKEKLQICYMSEPSELFKPLQLLMLPILKLHMSGSEAL